MKLSVALQRCGRCGKKFGLTHVCVTRMDRKPRTGGTKLAPKLSATVKCGTCGKDYSNPLTHVCAPKSDFKRRQAAAAKAKPKPKRPVHQYDACRDKDCERLPCEAHREGYDQGYADGMGIGYAAGMAAATANCNC